MKKRGFILLILVLMTRMACGQQDPVLSMYMFNNMAFNPGYCGTDGMINVTATTRQQWVGFEGAPTTMVFNANTPFSLFGISSGAGLQFESDAYGFNKDFSVSLDYSYLMMVGNGILGIGLNGGIINKAIKPQWEIPSGSSHTSASGDPMIPDGDESAIIPDASLGLFYKTQNYYAGLSVTHITQPKIKYTETNSFISREYYFTAGYTFQLNNPSLDITPSVFVVNDGAATQYILNGIVRYNKKAWGGVSYREGDAITGIVGFELYNGLKVGYSYDFPLSEIRKGTNGSHEFFVSYSFDIGLGKSITKYKSIRFL
ncbi:MAG TPA: type IX secretion system membrane protein PorP/SprF [Bacteroidales bacterium]|nr:type IX secretion system membrane protein PorP/SprF [Bacteroidales bacterium]